MGHTWNLLRLRSRASGVVPQALIAVAAMIAIAACGSGSAPPKATPSVNPQAAALAFSECMRAHGVNVPDPVSNAAGGGGVAIQISGNAQDPKSNAALTACQKYLPRVGGNGSQTPDPAREAQLLKFAQCMRSHGIDMPDPQTSGGRVSLGGPAGSAPNFDPNSTAFKNAQSACQHYLPGKGSGVSVNGGAGAAGSGVVSSGSGQ
jgi:hypothetical protein